MADRDVTVVGSGVIGLALAWRLGITGRQVTLVDPHPGRGASRVAAGMLAPITEAAYGEEALTELNLVSARAWPGFAAELEAASGLSVGLRREGTLLVAHDADDRAELEELARYQRELGLRARWCSAEECREAEPLLASSIFGGLLAEDDHQVDNRRLLSALAEAVRRQGARLCLSPLEGLEITAGAVRAVHAGGERIPATTVVLAAGHATSRLPGLPENLLAEIRPVKGQILRLSCADRRLRPTRTIRARVAGHSVYLLPRTDGQLVLGATVEERGPERLVTAGATYELLRDITRVLPVVHEYELTETSAGLRPASPDNAPMLGETAVRGLVVASGHYRNGILLAPASAAAIVELCETGALPAFARPFRPERFSDRPLERVS